MTTKGQTTAKAEADPWRDDNQRTSNGESRSRSLRDDNKGQHDSKSIVDDEHKPY
jgi:hypothetical protein